MSKKKTDLKNSRLKSFAPLTGGIENDEYINQYAKNLKNVINENANNNIAVTGSIGIGKSTVVRKCEKLMHNEFMYLVQ